MSSSLYAQQKLKITGSRGVVRKSRTLPRIRGSLKSEENLSIEASSLRAHSRQGSSVSVTMEGDKIPTVPLTSTSLNVHSEPNLREKVFGSFYPVKKGTPARLSSATATMDEQYRESLQRHYRLLMTHITLSDDDIQQMAKEKILPETMIKDIQDGETREERNERLLKSLRLRGNKSFKRFRELMYRTGNFFVADLLWEEGDCQLGRVDEKELAKFSGILGCVKENQKRRLLQYLDSKIREKALSLAWKDCPQERIEALSNKVIDFNQEKTFRDTITSQEQRIKELEHSLTQENENCRDLRMEMSALQQQIIILKRDHRSSIATQTRFHDANMSSIARLKDRLARCREGVAELNEVVKARIDVGADDTESSFEDEDFDIIPILERNVRKILHQLKHEQDHNREAQTQREDVLKLLNRRYSKEPLVSVVKDVLKHEQKHRSLVMRDILKLADTLKRVVPGAAASPNAPVVTTTSSGLPDPSTLDTKHFKSQLAMLIAEAEHIKKRFVWKDSEINTLRQEILSLRQRLGDHTFLATPDPTASSASPSASAPSTTTSNTVPASPTFRSPADQHELAPPGRAGGGGGGAGGGGGGAGGGGGRSSKATSPLSDRSGGSSGPPSKPSMFLLRPQADHSPKWQAGGRQHDPARRPAGAKVVTFNEALEGDGGQRTTAGAGAGGGGGLPRGGVHPDLDKTLVNIEQYLQDEREEEREEEEEEEEEADLIPASGRGEGDVCAAPKGGPENRSNSALRKPRDRRKAKR